LVDNGPSDVIHDLHAKYQVKSRTHFDPDLHTACISQAAVNKAEGVAQNALRAAAEALKEQTSDHDNPDAPGNRIRFKRSAEVRAHFSPLKETLSSSEEE